MSASLEAWAKDIVLQPRHIGLELEYFDILRDPYIPEDNGNWTYGAAIFTHFTLWQRAEWELFYAPRLRFRSTHSQIREGALQYETGIRIHKCRLFHRHESRHVMERGRGEKASGVYPLLNSYVGECIWEISP